MSYEYIADRANMGEAKDGASAAEAAWRWFAATPGSPRTVYVSVFARDSEGVCEMVDRQRWTRPMVRREIPGALSTC